MHEMFCMHIGQCGLQVGFALWELLCVEHCINRFGTIDSEESVEKNSFETFFNLSASGQYVPRGIFVDLEPTVIDQMRTGSFSQLYHPSQLISGNEDAANNFARGFHTVGRMIKNACENRIRKEFEISDRIQGIQIYRSLGGGTGSGMTATLFEIFAEYSKTAKIEIPIYPSPHLCSAIVEPYNSILSEHFCMDDIDISFLIDNEALYDIASEQMNVKEPNIHDINRIVGQVCSALTASSRFANELYNDLVVLTNLIPYPRIHFPLVSYAPFGTESKLSREGNSTSEITQALFSPSNQLVNCDISNGKYMSCSLVYRGNVNPTQVFGALTDIKSCSHVKFVDWCPTGFKVGIVSQPPQFLPNSHMGYTDKSVVMMTNTSSVSSVWHRLAQKFHRLYAKRSFVHWFVAEGLEECEFCESLYNLATLAKDYEEVSLETIVDQLRSGTPQNGEEGAASNEEGKGNKKGTKGESEKDGEGASDGNDDDDDEENASNTKNVNNCTQDYKLSKSWHKKFDSLLTSFYQNPEMKSNLKSNGFLGRSKQGNFKLENDLGDMTPYIKNSQSESWNLQTTINKSVNFVSNFEEQYIFNDGNESYIPYNHSALSADKFVEKTSSDMDKMVGDESTSFLIEELIRISSLK